MTHQHDLARLDVDEPRADPAAAATETGGGGARAVESGGPEAETIERLRQERDEFKDLLLRKSAEFDNYRKRVNVERREQADLAAADLIKELLPVLDDLERAARSEVPEQADAYRRGIELIGRRLAEILARRGVVPIDPLGATFDPREHEAVSCEPCEGARDQEVVEVLARGYRMGDRLLRPAMVKVASA